jgi:hypothetical protein
MSSTMPVLPWYRQLWPWLLMLMPATAVVGGVITFWLATQTTDSLVVDDYYREGKAINRQLARDRIAAELGLAGSLERGPDGRALLRLTAAVRGVLPPEVTVRLVHATRAELDVTLALSADGSGSYTAPQARLPAAGRWNILIEDPDRGWRLTAVANGFERPLAFEAVAP